MPKGNREWINTERCANIQGIKAENALNRARSDLQRAFRLGESVRVVIDMNDDGVTYSIATRHQ